jgi:glycosyltransferase involved in cell wall biosynthesis
MARQSGFSSLGAMSREPSFKDFPVYRMHWGWFPRPVPPLVALLIASAGNRAYEQYCRAHGQPDVIHAHNTFYGGYLAARLAQKHKLPYVLTEYSSSFLEGLVFLPGQAQIVAHTLRKADVRLVCGSSLIAPLHRYAPEQPIETVGCVVDTEYFTPGDTPIEDKPFVFLIIAQLKERRKGFDVLLKSFHKAFANRSDVELHIRGHGPLKPELDKLIETLGLQQVKFLPMMSRIELRDLVRRSHALVSSSTIETFGVSVAEAMACGKPVVTTRSGGPEDFVTEECGLVVEPGDVDAFAAAMVQLRQNYRQYDPARIRATIVERYSKAAYVAKLESAYRRAMEKS